MIRLAIVISHPTQYYAPWFREIAQLPDLALKVFYLWNFGVSLHHDRGFGQQLQWDVPLMDGYTSVFIHNRSRDPGTHHPLGLNNPTLVPELLRWGPQVILLFGYIYCSHLRLLLHPRLRSVPILFRGDSHNMVPRSGWKPWAAALLRRMLFQRFAAALAVGQANTHWLRTSGLSTNRIVLSPHAVDNARFLLAAPAANAEALGWRQELGIAAEAPVVLFAGKFEVKKRPLDLLAAFAALQHPSAVLVLVGSGVLEHEIRLQANSLASGRLVVLPFQNQRAMPRVYALADLVVLPSYGSGETWGLCINEAMNMARPVIVSSHVGCGPDLVVPGETGWVYPAGDVASLNAALSEALSDLSRLKAMGLAAQAKVSHFSYAEATAGLSKALASALP